jgi:hypothetical protein
VSTTEIKLTARQAIDFFDALDIAVEHLRGYTTECPPGEYAELKDTIERYEELQKILLAAFPEAIGERL